MHDDLRRYRAAIAFLDGLANLAPAGGDYMRNHARPEIYLKRTRDFLKRCGDPQKGFKYVHITGTSGKGTVTTMVHEGLAAGGARVGSFTSPFATAATEKIRTGDRYIAPGEFADIFEEVKPHIEAAYLTSPYGRPTYFEIFLAIALIYFKQQRCEWVVLEVGAGGEYDATNIIEKPVVTAITSIDYDHTHLLGRTLQAIATTKAGIIKKGSVFFTTEARPALLQIFKRICSRVGARFSPLPAVEDYQENNKTLARAIGHAAGLDDASIERGIEAARLPCRFEVLQEKPRVVLDGAHNRAKMRSTAFNVSRVPHKTVHLVIGLNAKKDADAVLAEIVPLASAIYVTRFQNSAVPSADPKKLAEKARSFLKKGVKARVFMDPNDALDAALKAAGPDDLVLVTGSFYLAGELRTRWYPEEWVLKNGSSFRNPGKRL